MGYNGFNHRLQVPKLSEEIYPLESKVVVKKDTVSDFTPKSKVVVQSTLLTPRPNRFTGALAPRGSKYPFRLAEGGAFPHGRR